MTDGIIQQVFKKVIDGYKSKLPNPYFSEAIERTINDFELLQQELIEKINQESKGLFYDKNRKKIVHWLIGDNKDGM